MKAKKLLVLLIIGTTLFSCAKDDDAPAPAAVTPTPTTPTPTPTPAGNTTGNAQPNFIGADATMWAVNSVTVTTISGLPPITTTIGIGVGVFLDASSSFVDVGTVQLNSNALTLNPNNSYVFVPGLSMPTGINFGSGVDWSVVGGNGW